MVRRNNIYSTIDWASIFIWVLLVAFGWMNIYSANFVSGDGVVFDLSERYGKQLLFIGVSILLIILIFILDSKFFAFFAYPMYGIIIFSLILVFLLGKEINGAKSWIAIGGFYFQPSEYAKPLTALALARLLSSHGFQLKEFKSYLLTGIVIFTPAILILLQPDMGSTLVYFAFLFVLYREGFSQNIMILGASLIILFVATLLIDEIIILASILIISLLLYRLSSGSNRKMILFFLFGSGIFGLLFGINYLFNAGYSSYTISLVTFSIIILTSFVLAIRARKSAYFKILTGLIIAAFFIVFVDYAMNNILKEHQQQRIYVTLGMKDDPQGVGYNVNQSKIAIGSGGFSGKGYLQGTQTKLHFVPEQSTDFIFCTVGEEWGFIGTTLVIILFISLIIRLIILAERQRSKFSRIYGYGLIAILLTHFIVNIGMTIGLFPVIGIPLPFFSYGGSSLLAFTVFLFVFIKLDSNRMELLR